VISVTLTEPAAGAAAPRTLSMAPAPASKKWLWYTLLAAGGAAGGIAFGLRGSAGSGAASPSVAASLALPPPAIGAPNIAIGKP
jgi:hypothetical protein